MKRKIIFVLGVFTLLSFLLYARLSPVEVNAPNGYPVHNLDNGLNYTTIQEAINAPETVDGHAILVDVGTYYEHVIVNKSITLIGKDRTTTIIDGNGTGTVVRVASDNVYISGFTIRNCSHGSSCIVLANNRNTTIAGNTLCYGGYCILLKYSRGNNIINNTMTNPDWDGIYLFSSSENMITGNNISYVDYAIQLLYSSDNNTISDNNLTRVFKYIRLYRSSFNTLRNNTLSKAVLGAQYFEVQGSSLEHFIQDIDESNTAGGKPIYYWVNQQEKQIPLDAGYVAVVNSTDIVVRDITMQNNYQGVLFAYTNDSKIENVTIPEQLWIHPRGIQFQSCSNISISRCQIVGCAENILIDSSNNNLITHNNLSSSLWYNVLLNASNNNIIADNILSYSRGGEAGIGLIISEGGNNIVRGNVLSNNLYQGVHISDSSNNTIYNNLIRRNLRGIVITPWFYYNRTHVSSNNTIYNNLITENDIGIGLWSENGNNRVYHNNFVDNKKHVSARAGFRNYLDNGYPSGGNYWSNYNGTDSNHDGIGDSCYEIDENNTDHYPLMGMFSIFNTSLGYGVNVISNSTIEDFEYFESNSTIMMHVSNMTANQTYGFCRLCIPKSLMSPPYTVTIDNGLTEVLYFNDTVFDNATHRWIYFAYPHSIHEIRVIPEFPSIIIMPLFMIATLVVATMYGRKRHL